MRVPSAVSSGIPAAVSSSSSRSVDIRCGQNYYGIPNIARKCVTSVADCRGWRDESQAKEGRKPPGCRRCTGEHGRGDAAATQEYGRCEEGGKDDRHSPEEHEGSRAEGGRRIAGTVAQGTGRHTPHRSPARARAPSQVWGGHIRTAALPCRRDGERGVDRTPRFLRPARFVLRARTELPGGRRCTSGAQEPGLDEKGGMRG